MERFVFVSVIVDTAAAVVAVVWRKERKSRDAAAGFVDRRCWLARHLALALKRVKKIEAIRRRTKAAKRCWPLLQQPPPPLPQNERGESPDWYRIAIPEGDPLLAEEDLGRFGLE